MSFDDAAMVHIDTPGGPYLYPLAEVRVTPRVGNTPRCLYLPGGAKCEVADNDLVDEVLSRYGRGRMAHLIHALESRLVFAALSAVVVVALVWGLVTYGIPALAKHAAFALPEATDVALGSGTLKSLDKLVLHPSKLDEATRQRLGRRFDAMTAELSDAHHYQLVFRSGGAVGANAFALPSGIIVMTDELVHLAKNDDELVGVLAHEIGHVVNRHTLRYVLQDSGVALVVAAIAGDLVSVSALAAALPTALVRAKYSRAFETEADDYARGYLKAHGMSPAPLADLLARMQRRSGEGGDLGYLSSHPATAERIRRLRGG